MDTGKCPFSTSNISTLLGFLVEAAGVEPAIILAGSHFTDLLDTKRTPQQ